MKIEKTKVFGFENSLSGMRNPLDSWAKSDSKVVIYMNGQYFDVTNNKYMEIGYAPFNHGYSENKENYLLGDSDKSLAQRLTKAGSEHCKFLRQIQVWVDLTLPRFIWSEFDTYKFNTKNSCSTMHTSHRRELTQNDFEYPVFLSTLNGLNDLIKQKKAKDITSEYYIHNFKNNLPDGFLQMRTVNTNYAELLGMYHQRKNHKLEQWHEICEWIIRLPYFLELTGLEV